MLSAQHRTEPMAQQEDTVMTNAPPTPGDDEDAQGSPDRSPPSEPTAPAIDYSPASAPYDEAFENALMEAILAATPAHPRTPLATPPIIDPTTLPVPLTSPLRTHASPIPGVLLTHANGYHTGGPGPAPSTLEEFARRFVAEEGVVGKEGLDRAVRRAIDERMEVVRERMREREEAIRRNRDVERELENLRVQRAAEVSVQEKLKGMKK